MVNIIVVTHGEFGAYLIEAAEEIVGRQDAGVCSVSISSRLPIAEAKERLRRAIIEFASADGIVVAVDMPGGTPCNIAMPLATDSEKISVVGGVNLYMMITAFNCRKTSPVSELAEKMIAAGGRSIVNIKEMFLARA